MNLIQWANKWLGNGIDYDNAFSRQCVDVYRQYLAELLKLKQSPGVAGAADIWNTYNKSDFDRIENSPNNFPEQGDIPIWERSKSNGNAGHIAIALLANAKKMVVLEQDGLTNSTFRARTVDYTKVLGWLRPKKTIPTNLLDLESDIPGWAEDTLNLKSYPWYDRKWTFVNLVTYTADLYVKMKDIEKILQDVRDQSTDEIVKLNKAIEAKNAELEELKKPKVEELTPEEKSSLSKFFKKILGISGS